MGSSRLSGVVYRVSEQHQYQHVCTLALNGLIHSSPYLTQTHIHTISVIDAMYPKFPTERQFRNNLESLLGGSDPSRPKYPILAHFMDDRERLSVGSALLPDLVEMYLWLDTHLAHLLPYEDDLKLTLGDIITKACKRYPSEAGHIRQLYERLTGRIFLTDINVNKSSLSACCCIIHMVIYCFLHLCTWHYVHTFHLCYAISFYFSTLALSEPVIFTWSHLH